MTQVSFTVHCPHCRGNKDMRAVDHQEEPRWTHRERRLVVECTSCRHVATLVLTLVDGIPNPRRQVAS